MIDICFRENISIFWNLTINYIVFLFFTTFAGRGQGQIGTRNQNVLVTTQPAFQHTRKTYPRSRSVLGEIVFPAWDDLLWVLWVFIDLLVLLMYINVLIKTYEFLKDSIKVFFIVFKYNFVFFFYFSVKFYLSYTFINVYLSVYIWILFLYLL